MLQRLKQQSGYTLIELLIGMIIVAILLYAGLVIISAFS